MSENAVLPAGEEPAGRPAPELPLFPMARSCPFDPAEKYAKLRMRTPVTEVGTPSGQENWLVTSYRLVRRLLVEPGLSSDRTNPGFPMPVALPPDMKRELDRVSEALLGPDPPRHTAARKTLISEFTVRRARAMRSRVQRIADDAIDTMAADPRPVDLVEAPALPVPSLVLCEVLGVPYADRALFQRRARTILDRASTPARRGTAAAEPQDHFSELITAKEADPGDDVLGRLTVRNRETGVFDHDALVGVAMLLHLAGHETTANVVSLGVVGLFEHPQQPAALTADPGLAPQAVEELLHCFTVLDTVYRVALRDIEVDGTRIGRGDGVILALGSANRDNAVFANTDRPDLRRPDRAHVSFAYGVHQCLGQNLARLELEVVLSTLSTLVTRLPGLRLAVPVGDLPFKEHSDAYGIFEVPVTW
ncbi:cytochrome P450 [Actinobacteria bacterium OK074]|nr:cytochrome P450 [Actinobacteria bacterium OK074]